MFLEPCQGFNPLTRLEVFKLFTVYDYLDFCRLRMVVIQVNSPEEEYIPAGIQGRFDHIAIPDQCLPFPPLIT